MWFSTGHSTQTRAAASSKQPRSAHPDPDLEGRRKEEEREAMEVMSMPASRLFKREMEKSPSPEKDEREQVVELSPEKDEWGPVAELSPEKEMDVLDLTHIDLDFEPEESLAGEIEHIEAFYGKESLRQPKLKPGDGGKMMELVSKEFIHELMKSPPCSSPFPDYSAEAIGHWGITDEDLEIVIKGFRAMEEARDIENDIIRQYRLRGYAYVELPDN